MRLHAYCQQDTECHRAGADDLDMPSLFAVDRLGKKGGYPNTSLQLKHGTTAKVAKRCESLVQTNRWTRWSAQRLLLRRFTLEGPNPNI